MKIAVMTLWGDFVNYGQQLQAYALQQVLKAEGHEPYVVRYCAVERKKKKVLRRKLLIIPQIKYRLVGRIIKKQNLWEKFKSNGVKEWMDENIVYSEEVWSSLDEIRSKPPQADVYLAGSDQIWRYTFNDSDTYPYFLDFGFPNVRRITYGASFGMSRYPKRYCKELGRLLGNIDALSVREKSGVDICASVGAKAVNVCDPVFLLPAEKWSSIIDETINGGVFIYNINIPEPQNIYMEDLKQMAQSRGLSINVCMGLAFTLSTECFGNDVNYYYGSMSQFLGGIRDADFVVAVGFHATAFAVLFHKKFVYVPIKGKYAKTNTRAFDLLNRLSLEGRIYDGSHSYDYYYDTPVDYSKAQPLLDDWREESMRFLMGSLES